MIDRLMIAGLATLAFCAAAVADAPDPRAAEARAVAARANDPALQWGPCPGLFPRGCEIAVLHGDPGKPNAAVFLRVAPGYVLPPHSHTSAEHIVLVSGELDVHYRGQPPVTLIVGDYAYGPPNLPHLGRCRSSVACTLLIAFELPVDAVAYEGSIG